MSLLFQTKTIKRNDIELEIKIHSHKNGIVVLNYPGITGTIDGYNNKYGQLADFLQEKQVGTIIRIGNERFYDLPYPQGMIDNFKFLIEYVLKNSEELSGIKIPQLYLMGFSAGASTIASIAGDYPEIKKILLCAPSGDAGSEAIKNGLNKFKGEVYITAGENDPIVDPEFVQLYYYNEAINSKHKEFKIIPNCDHQFTGEVNGRIMSQAPFWAFQRDKTFPNPEAGRKLYD